MLLPNFFHVVQVYIYTAFLSGELAQVWSNSKRGLRGEGAVKETQKNLIPKSVTARSRLLEKINK